jgi:hypothetical protein
MRFTLDAGGAQAAGQGIGNIFKAYVLGPQMRQQAEQEALRGAADLYYRRMAGDKYGAEAGKLGQEAEGLRLTNAARTGPVDDTLPANLQTAFKLFQATGDTNMERFANAGTALQTQDIRDQAVANMGNLDVMNRLNTLAKPGETYMPFKAVGDTGGAIDQATGQGVVFDQVLRKLFEGESGAKVARDRGAANASNANASKYAAEADIERQRAERLRTTGALPGTGAEGSEGALSSTVIRSMDIPILDEKGRPVTDAFGKPMMRTDQDALKRFYGWATENNRKPTATAFAQWEAQGRPAGNKNPPPAQTTPKIGAIENGYRFKGGDPASPSSWEKVR